MASEVKKCSVSSPACLTSDLSWVQVAPLSHRDHILCWTGLEKREGLKLKWTCSSAGTAEAGTTSRCYLGQLLRGNKCFQTTRGSKEIAPEKNEAIQTWTTKALLQLREETNASTVHMYRKGCLWREHWQVLWIQDVSWLLNSSCASMKKGNRSWKRQCCCTSTGGICTSKQESFTHWYNYFFSHFSETGRFC